MKQHQPRRFARKAIALLGASALAMSACAFAPASAMAANPVTISGVRVAPLAGDGYAAALTAAVQNAAADQQLSIAVFPAVPLSVTDGIMYPIEAAKHLDQVTYSEPFSYSFELGMDPMPGRYFAVVGGTNAQYATALYETNVPAPAMAADPVNPKTVDVSDIGGNAKFCFIPSAADPNTRYFLSMDFGPPTAQVRIGSGEYVTVPCTVDGDKVCVDASGVLADAPAGAAALSFNIKAVGFEAASATADVKLITGGNIPVDSVTVSASASTVKKGTAIQLKVNITPDNATDKSVKWTSSSESVATVDANGVVTGLKTGTVRITATTANGKSYMFLLMVTA